MIFRIAYLRRLLVLCLSFVAFLILVLIIRNNSADKLNRTEKLNKILESIKNEASLSACRQPNLSVNSPEIMKFVHEMPPIDCKAAGIDWVVCEGSKCKVKEQINYFFGPVKCSFTDLIRTDDFTIEDGETTHSDSYYKLVKSDVVRVSCTSSEKSWSSVLTGVRSDKQIWHRTSWNNLPENAFKVNVLMFGLDSVSRNTFVRKLPKSHDYLVNTLQAHILQGYNIVGDGTPQALIPILTGKTELELPDTRKRMSNTQFVNSYPFIWNDFKEAGYVTAFLEDVPELGTFTYRLNGFNEPPTDHYMRPYYLASYDERSKWPKLCAGSIPRHKVMLNYIRDFFNVYKSKPKFLFGFHGELSHDSYNLVGVADNDVLEFLSALKDYNVLNNTILIIMADHGHRFAEIRNTVQGKQEERLPFFSFVFPKWFKTKHKEAYDNFVGNIDKLSTPFDIFLTLKDVLNFDGGRTDNRSMSLFSKIPEERSCASAFIEPHWCACLDWYPVSLSTPIAQELAQTLTVAINNYTKGFRHLCSPLGVLEIVWITKLAPNENLIRFNKNADLDGFVPDMSAKMDIQTDVYQIKVVFTPGNSIFEASITHYKNKNEFQLKMSDVSRVNMYGKQARCIEEHHPELRKYCYCRD